MKTFKTLLSIFVFAIFVIMAFGSGDSSDSSEWHDYNCQWCGKKYPATSDRGFCSLKCKREYDEFIYQNSPNR